MGNKLTVNINQPTSVFMLRMIRRMVIGEALVSKPWRLERVQPRVGFEYYILYRHNKADKKDEVVGIQYVRTASWLNAVQEALADYLTLLGCAPDTSLFGIARTRDTFAHNRLPQLFQLKRRSAVVIKVGQGFNAVRPPVLPSEAMRYETPQRPQVKRRPSRRTNARSRVATL